MTCEGKNIGTFLRRVHPSIPPNSRSSKTPHCAMMNFDGPHAAYVEEPEYEQMAAWGPVIGQTAVAETKGLMQLEDSGTCRFNTRMNLERLSAAVAAATGWDFTSEEGMRVGRRAVNLMRAFNLRAGIGKEHDRPSARYGSTPVDGPSAGISILPHWEAMLRNYYELLGWDPETGVPLPLTLEGLGLGHVSKDLENLR